MAEVCVSTTQEVSLEGRVIRCGCTLAQKQAPDWHARRGIDCPNPRAIEDLGRMAYWHRNPLRRWAWRIDQWLDGRRPSSVTFQAKE
jgi:hypothetical protein